MRWALWRAETREKERNGFCYESQALLCPADNATKTISLFQAINRDQSMRIGRCTKATRFTRKIARLKIVFGVRRSTFGVRRSTAGPSAALGSQQSQKSEKRVRTRRLWNAEMPPVVSIDPELPSTAASVSALNPESRRPEKRSPPRRGEKWGMLHGLAWAAGSPCAGPLDLHTPYGPPFIDLHNTTRRSLGLR